MAAHLRSPQPVVLEVLMTRSNVVVVAALAFAAGLAGAEFISTVHAQNGGGGTLTELKRVDLESWCAGKR